jgi:glycosyltransferase involved in cell wall biosynthesis
MEKLLENIKIFLPTKNEAKAIKKVIKELRNVGFKKIIVIDGHSIDGTIETVKMLNIPIIFDDGNGKGSAIKAAFSFIKNNEIIAMMDADYTYSAKDLKKMILIAKNCSEDVIIGNRFSKMNFKSISPSHFIGNIFLNKMFNLLWCTNIPDLCSGIRVFKSEICKKIKLNSKGFDVEAELNAKIIFNKGKIRYVPIKYRPRIGKSKVQIKDGFLIFLRIIRDFWNLKLLNSKKLS